MSRHPYPTPYVHALREAALRLRGQGARCELLADSCLEGAKEIETLSGERFELLREKQQRTLERDHQRCFESVWQLLKHVVIAHLLEFSGYRRHLGNDVWQCAECGCLLGRKQKSFPPAIDSVAKPS